MGGDGGVLAVKRKFMQGLTTTRSAKTGTGSRYEDSDNRGGQSHEDYRKERLSTCVVSGKKLDVSGTGTVVVDDFGNLYDRLSVVEFLISKKQKANATDAEEADADLAHLNLLTIYPITLAETCPISSQPLLTGGATNVYMISCASKSASCLANGVMISDKAVKEFGYVEVCRMVGCSHGKDGRVIKLLADNEECVVIRDRMIREEGEAQERKNAKKIKKEKKERWKDSNADEEEEEEEKHQIQIQDEKSVTKKSRVKTIKNSYTSTKKTATTTLTMATSQAQALIQQKSQSSVYANLFTNESDIDNNLTQKEKNNRLFSCSAGRRF